MVSLLLAVFFHGNVFLLGPIPVLCCFCHGRALFVIPGLTVALNTTILMLITLHNLKVRVLPCVFGHDCSNVHQPFWYSWLLMGMFPAYPHFIG